MKKGFTLVELMVVISIIGLVLSIAIPSIMEMQENSYVEQQVSSPQATPHSSPNPPPSNDTSQWEFKDRAGTITNIRIDRDDFNNLLSCQFMLDNKNRWYQLSNDDLVMARSLGNGDVVKFKTNNARVGIVKPGTFEIVRYRK